MRLYPPIEREPGVPASAASPVPAGGAAGAGGILRLETVIVALIAFHSAAVGAVLLLAPEAGVRFGGWDGVDPVFFPRQAGVFHLLVATAYILEYIFRGGVVFLVTAKTVAAVFLFSMMLLDGGAWCVPVSGLADALMAIVVLLIHPRARRRRKANAEGAAARRVSARAGPDLQ